MMDAVKGNAVNPEWPILPPDYKVSDDILNMSCIAKDWHPSEEELEADFRLAHIWKEISDQE